MRSILIACLAACLLGAPASAQAPSADAPVAAGGGGDVMESDATGPIGATATASAPVGPAQRSTPVSMAPATTAPQAVVPPPTVPFPEQGPSRPVPPSGSAPPVGTPTPPPDTAPQPVALRAVPHAAVIPNPDPRPTRPVVDDAVLRSPVDPRETAPPTAAPEANPTPPVHRADPYACAEPRIAVGTPYGAAKRQAEREGYKAPFATILKPSFDKVQAACSGDLGMCNRYAEIDACDHVKCRSILKDEGDDRLVVYTRGNKLNGASSVMESYVVCSPPAAVFVGPATIAAADVRPAVQDASYDTTASTPRPGGGSGVTPRISPWGIACGDGTTSHAETRRGSCSHHGGVAGRVRRHRSSGRPRHRGRS